MTTGSARLVRPALHLSVCVLLEHDENRRPALAHEGLKGNITRSLGILNVLTSEETVLLVAATRKLLQQPSRCFIHFG